MAAGYKDALAAKSSRSTLSLPGVMAGLSLDQNAPDRPTAKRPIPDAPLPPKPARGQVCVHRIITSAIVEGCITVLIFLSMVLMVIETDRSAARQEPLPELQIINGVILAAYTAELLAKLYIHRCRFFLSGWNIMDMLIVLTDYIGILVENLGNSSVSLSFLRVLRLLRIARAARVIKYFPQLWEMLRGLYATLKVVASGLCLIAGCLIIIGVIAVLVLHPINERVAARGLYDDCERCSRAFDSTASSVLTFAQQIITGDSWGAVSVPIIEEEPLTALYFAAVFIFIQLMVMNIILGLVVESSIKAAATNTERLVQEKQKEFFHNAETFGAMCKELDTDESGHISKAELLEGFETNPRFDEFMQLLELSHEDIDMLFDMLDTDGSGEISYDEFVNELHKLRSHDSHTMLVCIKHHVQVIKDLVRSTVERELVDLRREIVNAGSPPGAKAEEKAKDPIKPCARAQEETQDLLLGSARAACLDGSSRLEDIEESLRDLRMSLSLNVSHLAQELVAKELDFPRRGGAMGPTWSAVSGAAVGAPRAAALATRERDGRPASMAPTWSHVSSASTPAAPQGLPQPAEDESEVVAVPPELSGFRACGGASAARGAHDRGDGEIPVFPGRRDEGTRSSSLDDPHASRPGDRLDESDGSQRGRLAM